MTKYLAIAFLITGFLVGDAYGEEEVFYCAGIAGAGFTGAVCSEGSGPISFPQPPRHNNIASKTMKVGFITSSSPDPYAAHSVYA